MYLSLIFVFFFVIVYIMPWKAVAVYWAVNKRAWSEGTCPDPSTVTYLKFTTNEQLAQYMSMKAQYFEENRSIYLKVLEQIMINNEIDNLISMGE